MADPPPLPRTAAGRGALAVARECARAGARIAREGFSLPAIAGVKGRGNIVTETDFAVESRIIEILGAEFPDHRVLSEETRPETDTEGWVWVIDPIDGTKNFSKGIPFFCINIALCHDGEPVLGLTYDPMRREEFLAVKGRGLRVNGRPAFASTASSVLDSVVGIDTGFSDSRGATTFQVMTRLWPNVQAFRNLGSAALGIAYAAAGRLDLFVHHYLYPWDVAAGLVLVREGGGSITDRDGGPATLFTDNILAGSPEAHSDFLRLTKGLNWRGS